MSHLIFYILIGLTFANLCLLILMLNAVHSLLLLIQIFLFGSWFLFLLNMEFFGLIFLMIYLGAILVLFLFVVMMLDIKVAVVEHDDLGGFFYKSFFI
jgi:NADH-quinone oxidoreductase subunit J